MVEQKKKKVNLRMKLKSLERSDFIGKLDVFLCQISKHKFPNLKFGVIEMPVCAKSLQSCSLEGLMLKLKLQYFGHLM